MSLTLDGSVLALEDFFERFHSDIFNYHASRIVKLLNEIQWGAYNYLLPEYQRSYVYEGGAMKKYHFLLPRRSAVRSCKVTLLGSHELDPSRANH